MSNLGYIIFTYEDDINTNEDDNTKKDIKYPYPIETLLQIPYFKTYIHFDNNKNVDNRGCTGKVEDERIFKLQGDPDTFEKMIYLYTTDWEEFGCQKSMVMDFDKCYRLGDYLGISAEELGEKILENSIFQLPNHLINRQNVELIPKMLLDFKAKKFGKEVCVVYALDIDTTLITDKIHSYIIEIGSWVLIKEYSHIFSIWIRNSDEREIDWLFEYSKISILDNFIKSNSEKFNVKANLIGFYFFYLIGSKHISKIKKEDLIKNILNTWIKEKPWLGGDNELETWLMVCCYIGFKLIESKSQLGFFRSFDKPLVLENMAANQWIDDTGGHQNLLDIEDIEYICDNFNRN